MCHRRGILEATWLLMDVAHQGEVRLASVSPTRPAVDHITRFASDSLQTFTDALLRYERETGQHLLGMTAVIAIAGAAVGESIPIIRTRWNISRAGIESMTGCPPVVINEVAAQAWATVGALPMLEPIRGTGTPDLRAKGRYVFVAINDGVGTAIIDIDDAGHVTVIEAEGGHADFAPQTEAELTLARAMAPIGGAPSWEQMLMIRRETAPAKAVNGLTDQYLAEMRATLLGRFIATMMLMTGAWSGAMMTGSAIPHYDSSMRRAFNTGLNNRRAFLRLFNAARCWRVEQREPVLSGAAALMVQRHHGRTGG